ncbi:MAG: hypothetical protein ACRDCB_10065 [Clostridium sp.]
MFARKEAFLQCRFILTMWNVNSESILRFDNGYEGFILTMWNVNVKLKQVKEEKIIVLS